VDGRVGGGRTERARILDEYRGMIAESESLKGRAARRDALMAAVGVLEHLPISDQLHQNQRTLGHLFAAASDWVLRPLRLAQGREALVTYIEGLVDKASLERHVIAALMRFDGVPASGGEAESGPPDLVEHIKLRILQDSQVREIHTIKDAVDGMLHGDTCLLVDGETRGLLVSARAYEKRGVGEPETESIIRGPREGFVENLRSNTALIRRRLRTPQLKLELARAGRRKGARASVPVRVALASDEGFPREGQLDFLDNQVDPATGTIRARAILRNPDLALTPGLFVRVRLQGRPAYDGVLIQDRAVATDLDKRYVLVVDGRQTIEYREVTLGPIVDGLRVVRDGLSPGERIVVSGLQRVRPGMTVSPVEVAMTGELEMGAQARAQ